MPIARDEHDVRANDGFGNSYGHLASDHAIGARFCVMEPLLRNEVIPRTATTAATSLLTFSPYTPPKE